MIRYRIVKKKCNKCKIPLALEHFYDHKKGKYGKASICKYCTSDTLKLNYQKKIIHFTNFSL